MFKLSALACVLTLALGAVRGIELGHPSLCPDGTPAKEVITTELDGFPVIKKTCSEASAPELVAKATKKIKTPKGHVLDFSPKKDTLEKRLNYNTCGGWCTTYCWTPSGGGPDPNDCSTLASSLRSGNGYTWVSPGTVVWWTHRSCSIVLTNLQINQDGNTGFCHTQVADIADYVAWNCQSQQNAHGGQCNFNNGNPQVGNVLVQA